MDDTHGGLMVLEIESTTMASIYYTSADYVRSSLVGKENDGLTLEDSYI